MRRRWTAAAGAIGFAIAVACGARPRLGDGGVSDGDVEDAVPIPDAGPPDAHPDDAGMVDYHDPTFGVDGIVTVMGEWMELHPLAVAVDGENRIAVTGMIVNATASLDRATFVVRFLADGAIDSGFGTDGWVQLDADYNWFGEALTADAEGRLLIGAHDPGNGFKVARLTDTGALDTTFGDAGYASYLGTTHVLGLHSILVEPEGRIVSASNSLLGPAHAALVGFREDGTLDPDFGSGGVMLASNSNMSVGLAKDTAGRWLVAGKPEIYDNSLAWRAWRFLPSGALDPSFDGDGAAGGLPTGEMSRPRAVGVDSAGAVVIGGTVDRRYAAVRILDDGTPDPSFGVEGAAFHPNMDLVEGEPVAMFVQGRRVLLAGWWYTSTPGQRSAALFRYDGYGNRDGSFAPGGVYVYPFAEDLLPTAATRGPDGSIVVVGAAGPLGTMDPLPWLAVLRFRP